MSPIFSVVKERSLIKMEGWLSLEGSIVTKKEKKRKEKREGGGKGGGRRRKKYP